MKYSSTNRNNIEESNGVMYLTTDLLYTHVNKCLNWIRMDVVYGDNKPMILPVTTYEIETLYDRDHLHIGILEPEELMAMLHASKKMGIALLHDKIMCEVVKRLMGGTTKERADGITDFIMNSSVGPKLKTQCSIQ
jgi:hypothetical protein